MARSAHFDDVEWIVKTDTVGVRVNTLGPGQATPWHFHTAVADDVFCLETPVEIGLRAPDETVTLAPGQRQHIDAGRVHRVAENRFFLPGAVERLRELRSAQRQDEPEALVLAAADPAQPYGAALPWPKRSGARAARSGLRSVA